jgi:hypothetical protein
MKPIFTEIIMKTEKSEVPLVTKTPKKTWGSAKAQPMVCACSTPLANSKRFPLSYQTRFLHTRKKGHVHKK